MIGVIIQGEMRISIAGDHAGSGLGASVVATKIPGIRAGLCHDTYSAH
jgi:ribose 5-phosphate isomerase RpiB